MSVIDIFFGIVLAFGAYKGFSKGLIIEVATLIALLLGIYGAIHFSGYTGEVLRDNLNLETKYIDIIAFAATFIAIVFVVHLAARIVEKFVNLVALGIVNKILGAVFALLKYAFLLSVLIFLLVSFGFEPLIPEAKRQSSLFYAPISKIAPSVFPHLKELVAELPETVRNAVQNTF